VKNNINKQSSEEREKVTAQKITETQWNEEIYSQHADVNMCNVLQLSTQ
jgi:hypothetical protein